LSASDSSHIRHRIGLDDRRQRGKF
jgi:hypothetical protein